MQGRTSILDEDEVAKRGSRSRERAATQSVAVRAREPCRGGLGDRVRVRTSGRACTRGRRGWAVGDDRSSRDRSGPADSRAATPVGAAAQLPRPPAASLEIGSVRRLGYGTPALPAPPAFELELELDEDSAHPLPAGDARRASARP